MLLQFVITWVAQVNGLPNLQHKIHLDNKLDKVLETLQAEEPNVEGIKLMLEQWSAWVRYCQGNPRYIFKEFQQVCVMEERLNLQFLHLTKCL